MDHGGYLLQRTYEKRLEAVQVALQEKGLKIHSRDFDRPCTSALPGIVVSKPPEQPRSGDQISGQERINGFMSPAVRRGQPHTFSLIEAIRESPIGAPPRGFDHVGNEEGSYVPTDAVRTAFGEKSNIESA